jgi:hypothetical protein
MMHKLAEFKSENNNSVFGKDNGNSAVMGFEMYKIRLYK